MPAVALPSLMRETLATRNRLRLHPCSILSFVSCPTPREPVCALCARPGSNMGLVGQDFGENVHVYSRPGASLLLRALVSSHRELFDLELRLEALVDDARVPAEVVQRPDAGRVFRGQVLVCAAPQQDGAVRRGGQGCTKRAREETASSTSLVFEENSTAHFAYPMLRTAAPGLPTTRGRAEGESSRRSNKSTTASLATTTALTATSGSNNNNNNNSSSNNNTIATTNNKNDDNGTVKLTALDWHHPQARPDLDEDNQQQKPEVPRLGLGRYHTPPIHTTIPSHGATTDAGKHDTRVRETWRGERRVSRCR